MPVTLGESLWVQSIGSRAWQRMRKLANDWLPTPQTLHPWPDQRFAVTNSRWEPRAELMFLAAPPQHAQPNALDVETECLQRRPIEWDSVIGDEAPDDLLEPSPLRGDRLVHSPSQFLLDGLELGPHSVVPGFPHDEEPRVESILRAGARS